jgi:thioredoxin reductase (NADPH)
MITTDAVVIGAGPIGLFQVFQLGLLGLKAEIIDVLPHAGGQCIALYPDKPIYDIPGVPVCTGRELTQQLLAQARPFLDTDHASKAPIDGLAAQAVAQPLGQARNVHLGHMVSSVQAHAEGELAAQFDIHTEQGLHIRCRAVFVAAGAGAFAPRSLSLPGLDTARNVYFHLPEAGHGCAPWAGQDLVISGGGDEALSAALSLATHPDEAQRPSSLSLLHRRDQFQAEPELEAAVRSLIAHGQIKLEVGMPTAAHLANDAAGSVNQSDQTATRLAALDILGADSLTRTLPVQHLLIRQGMSPKLGPLTQWGLALERKQVAVSTASFESSTPGIYAVGDINTYPGKKRLLLCGFHEATLAAHHAAARLNPDAPQHLLYTTTSPLLHQRLGLPHI